MISPHQRRNTSLQARKVLPTWRSQRRRKRRTELPRRRSPTRKSRRRRLSVRKRRRPGLMFISRLRLQPVTYTNAGICNIGTGGGGTGPRTAATPAALAPARNWPRWATTWSCCRLQACCCCWCWPSPASWSRSHWTWSWPPLLPPPPKLNPDKWK